MSNLQGTSLDAATFRLLLQVPYRDASHGLVTEAEARLQNPLSGMVGKIIALQQELRFLREELANAQQKQHLPCLGDVWTFRDGFQNPFCSPRQLSSASVSSDCGRRSEQFGFAAASITSRKAMRNRGSCDCELRKAAKRRRKNDEEEGNTTSAAIDRLSHLPQPILSHILSFLDTKSAVQTAVLSRVWRSTWKHVPVLHFRRDSFVHVLTFKRFVRLVLSSRCQNSVRRVSYALNAEPLDAIDKITFGRVIKYALSHDTQQLVLDAGNARFYEFPRLFGSISNCNLKSLELRHIILCGRVRSSVFPMLTTLNLFRCHLDTLDHYEPDIDLISNFPCLMNLVMRKMRCIGPQPVIKVHGPQLVSLELDGMECFEIEIFAPKLKSFQFVTPLYQVDITDPTGWWTDQEYHRGAVQQYLHSFFQGLHDAKSLKLDTYEIQGLRKISGFLEEQPSPFRILDKAGTPKGFSKLTLLSLDRADASLLIAQGTCRVSKQYLHSLFQGLHIAKSLESSTVKGPKMYR
ncbi:unnamed protein product, partial [Linum tenue]